MRSKTVLTVCILVITWFLSGCFFRFKHTRYVVGTYQRSWEISWNLGDTLQRKEREKNVKNSDTTKVRKEISDSTGN